MANLLSWGSAAFHGLNPFDGGQGWTNQKPKKKNELPQVIVRAPQANPQANPLSFIQNRNPQFQRPNPQPAPAQPHPNVAQSVFNAATTSERTLAQGLARLLPGGQNDLKAQNAATDSYLKNIKQINDLRDSGKITNQQASKILKSINQGINQGINQNSKDIQATAKSIPSRGQLVAGTVGTAADILTAGTLPQIKAGFVGSKFLNPAIKYGSFATSGGLNAAAGGGDKKQIAENAALGAAFPLALTGVGKGGSALINKLPKSTPPPKVTSKASDLSSHLDNVVKLAGHDPNANLVSPNKLYTNPITSNYNKAVQGYRNLIDKGRDKTTDLLSKGVNSDNGLVAGISRSPRVAFSHFGRSEAGRQALVARTSGLEAAGKASELAYKDLQKATKNLGPDHNERIYRILEDSKFLKRVYGDGKKLKVTDLAPDEKKAFDKLVEYNKIRNQVNYETGQIDKKLYEWGKSGLHSPRVYDLKAYKANPDYTGSSLIDVSAGQTRKDFEKLNKNITSRTLESPYAASSQRLELALRNKANVESLQNLDKAGQILDNAPNRNFVELKGKKYGPYQGKFADKQIVSELENKQLFNTNVGQKTGDLTSAYAKSPLGQADKTLKTAKTALAPAVGVGNASSNVFAFSGAANINPATMTVRMAQAAKQLAKNHQGFDANVYRAEKAGLFSGNTGEQLLGLGNEELAKLGKTSKNPIKAAARLYGATDRAAGLGMFNELKARGLSDAQAVRRVHAALQNYANAGRGITTLADAPVLGKPFARFTPELLRIAKNNAIYNPIGSAAKLGALAAGLNYASNRVGETPQERKAREEAVGQTQLPFTSAVNKAVGGPSSDISLNLPIGQSSTNIARLAGLNFPIEPGGDAKGSFFRQLDPTTISDMTRADAQGKQKVLPERAISSLSLKPIGEQLANRDFMGRTISDPKNKTYIEGVGEKGKKYAGQPPTKDQIKDRGKHLASGYLPGFSESNAIASALGGKPDYYGKTRTATQGFLRAGGLKTEANDKAARQKRVENQAYFEGQAKQVNDFLRNNQDLKDAYATIKSNTRTRDTNTKVNDIISPEKWKIIAAQKDNRLFNQLRTEAYNANKKDGVPIDPVYKLPQDQAKEVIDLRSRPTGDDIERQDILRATSPWYKQFEKNQTQFYKDQKAYYDKRGDFPGAAKMNPRVKDYISIPHPEMPSLAQQYMTLRYGKDGVGGNEAAGKAFYKANADTLSKQFSDYKAARLEEINAKRKIEGFPPIDASVYDNVTYGFNPDEKKVLKTLQAKYGGGYGYSYGGGSGGSKSFSLSAAKNANKKVNVPSGVKVKAVATPSFKDKVKGYKVATVKSNYLSKKIR